MDLFRAFHTALKSGAVILNMKDMVIALNLLVQIAPAALWGEAMHISGLFAYLLNALIEGEVCSICRALHPQTETLPLDN